MSSVDYLREFVSARLAAAAEDIFRVFKETIVEYEEELQRQRALLDCVWKPAEHHVCEEEAVAEQQLCVHERSSSVEQEEPEPPHIKEEEEQLCSSEQGEQPALKQETDAFLWTVTQEESDHSEDPTLTFSPEHAAQRQSVLSIPVISCVLAEPISEQQLLSHSSHEAQSPHLRGGPYGLPGSAGDAGHTGTYSGKKAFRCDTCGKDFKYKSLLQRHLRTHTDEKPYTCKTCGKGFKSSSTLTVHIRTHTGEKPYVCKSCEKRFCDVSALIVHMRIHTGEKPYSCKTCGRAFRLCGDLTVHMRTHTGEKPYVCKICGKRYVDASNLSRHIKSHADKSCLHHTQTQSGE